MRVESASSIQKVDSDDSIVAYQRDAADFFDSIGHNRTSCSIWKALLHSALFVRRTGRNGYLIVAMQRGKARPHHTAFARASGR